jgi:hypothetical protein
MLDVGTPFVPRLYDISKAGSQGLNTSGSPEDATRPTPAETIPCPT